MSENSIIEAQGNNDIPVHRNLQIASRGADTEDREQGTVIDVEEEGLVLKGQLYISECSYLSQPSHAS